MKNTKKYPKIPYVGQKFYVPSSYHISNGSSDIEGGLATVKEAYKSMSGGEMVWFVELEEIPNSGYNCQLPLA